MTVEELINQVATTDITGILALGKVVLVAYVIAYAVLFLVLAFIIGKIALRRR